MKKSGAIWHKLKQLRFRHMKTYLKEGLKQTPQNCQYNCIEKFRSGKEIGLCKFVSKGPQPWSVICDPETEEGLKRALRCPAFEPKKTPEKLKEEFNFFMESSSMGQIAYRYGDMAALMWVLEPLSEEGEWPLEAEEPQGPPALDPPKES